MDLQRLGHLTNENVWAILSPAADLLRELFTEKIKSIFQQHTGKLANAIQGFRKSSEDGPYILVYPYGDHHKYNARGFNAERYARRSKRGSAKGYKKSKKAGTKTASANEVAFVLEYGDGHHTATHWMEGTMEQNDFKIHNAMQEGFDAFCEERGL